MKISQAEFRRLHYANRALDRVCRLLWPNGDESSTLARYVTDEEIGQAIGTYRPRSHVDVLADEIHDNHERLSTLSGFRPVDRKR